MNQMKTRLQALGLLDRALRETTDDELAAALAGLDDDHREALERLVGASGDALTPEAVRAAATRGRMNGTMESLAIVVADAVLADCVDKLGDHSEDPTREQLQEVLPGVVQRHGLAMTRVMLASTVAGEAKAAAVIRDLLKSDELVKLPKEEPRRLVPALESSSDAVAADPERDALKARRLEARRRKQAEAAARREQATRDRRRV